MRHGEFNVGAIFHRVAKGELDLQLRELTLTDGKGLSFNGRGTLHWSNDSTALAEAETQGADSLREELGRVYEVPGQLLQDDRLLTLTALTSCGRRVTATRLRRECCEVGFQGEGVGWQFERSHLLGSLVVEEVADSDLVEEEATFLISPPLGDYSQPTTTIVKNAEAEYESTEWDWIEFSSNDSRWTVRRGYSSFDVVRVKSARVDFDESFHAIVSALSFLHGRRVTCEVAEHRSTKATRTYLLRIPTGIVATPIFRPLGYDGNIARGPEALLPPSVRFFSSDLGNEASSVLGLCLSAAGSSYNVQSLALTTSVERLVKLIENDKPSRRVDDETVGRVDAAIRPYLDDDTVGRVLGLLKSLHSFNATTSLRSLAAAGRFGIVKDEVSAWSKVRNSLAHGGTLFDTRQRIQQSEIDAVDRVKTLILRLMLGLMEYQYPFYDHGLRQYATLPRPLCTEQSAECPPLPVLGGEASLGPAHGD